MTTRNFENCEIVLLNSFNEKNHVCKNTGITFHERHNSWGDRSWISLPNPNGDEKFQLWNGSAQFRNTNAIEQKILLKFWNTAGEDRRLSLFESMRSNYSTIVDMLENPAKIFATEPNPTWVKEEDLKLIAERLEKEFEAKVHVFGNKYIAEYDGQMWDIATGEGSFTVAQGSYDYMYFPKIGQNIAHRLPFLSLREGLHLSKETVKTFLYSKEATKVSRKEMAVIFDKWLGGSSSKPKYWYHSDWNTDDARVSVIANHAKDMMVLTISDGVHVFFDKKHYLVSSMPHNFYKFCEGSLEKGKDYSHSGTGWPLTW